MENSIFREKSVDNISSPDSLNDYIRVVSPSVWVTLAAVILLLIGVTVWGITGSLDTVAKCAVVSDGTKSVVYVENSYSKEIKKDFQVNVNGELYTAHSAEYAVKVLSEQDNGDVLNILESADGTKVYEYYIDADLESGIYNASILLDSVKPISFVIN